jgi:hypothetical protein
MSRSYRRLQSSKWAKLELFFPSVKTNSTPCLFFRFFTGILTDNCSIADIEPLLSRSLPHVQRFVIDSGKSLLVLR